MCNVFNLFELRQNYLFEQTNKQKPLFNVYPECVLCEKSKKKERKNQSRYVLRDEAIAKTNKQNKTSESEQQRSRGKGDGYLRDLDFKMKTTKEAINVTDERFTSFLVPSECHIFQKS